MHQVNLNYCTGVNFHVKITQHLSPRINERRALIESNKFISPRAHGGELHLPGEIRRRAKIEEVILAQSQLQQLSAHLSLSLSLYAPKGNQVKPAARSHCMRCEREEKRDAPCRRRQLIILHSPISSDEPVESMREARTQQLNRIRTHKGK
jgi:hypothetical protein